jgi:O-antigen ligase
MSELALFPAASRSRTISRPVALVFLSAATLVIFLGLNSHPSYLIIMIAAIAVPAVLLYGVAYVARHDEWLIFPLALLLLLVQISFLSDRVRAPFHYGTLVLFCLPVLPKVWRSGILSTGGFKLYVIYFAWAAVTITYSLAPLYSLARLSEAVLVMIALAACALNIREPADATRLLYRFLMACGAMLIILTVAYPILPHDIAWLSPFESYTAEELATMSKAGISISGLDRFRGLFNGPNDVGAFMLVAVSTALVCWQAASKRVRVMLGAMVIVALGFDVLADSRSAFAAIALGGSLFVMWKWRLRGVLLCAGALAAAAVMMIHAGLFDYIGRGDVTTLTGRTDMWDFVIQKIRERPFFGYGYETSGAVFESKFFPLWWGPWDLGPHSSLHNGYLGHAIGVGLPATALWLYIVLRPWVFALRQPQDPWNLKPIFFFVVIPILINNLSEQLLDDFGGGIVALLFGLVWVIAERFRLLALERAERDRKSTLNAMPTAARALASSW